MGQTDAGPAHGQRGQPCLEDGARQCGRSSLVCWFIRPLAGKATWKNRVACVRVLAAWARKLASPCLNCFICKMGPLEPAFTRSFCGLHQFTRATQRLNRLWLW